MSELEVTIEAEASEADEFRKAAARDRFNGWTRLAIKFIAAGNAGGLVVGVWHAGITSPIDGPSPILMLAFVIFAIGLLSAGIAIMAYWRHSATYVAEGADLGLLDAVPQRLGEWLFPRASWLAVTSFCTFVIGLVMGLSSLVTIPTGPGMP